MKLACITSAVCAALMLCALAVLPARVCLTNGSNHVFYCGTSSADCREYKPVFNSEAERLLLLNVCGESAEYKDLDIESYLQSVEGKILFSERTDNAVNYYCSAKLPYSVIIKGYSVNLHICVRENDVKVGTPIIFGGY